MLYNLCGVQECFENSKEEWKAKLSECTLKYEEHIGALNTEHASQLEVSFTTKYFCCHHYCYLFF